MNQYENSAYGFCENCRKTDVPSVIEYESGKFDLICPTCAAREYDDADLIAKALCWEKHCVRVSEDRCLQCDDPLCVTHTYDGYCSSCVPRDYSKGWQSQGHGFHH